MAYSFLIAPTTAFVKGETGGLGFDMVDNLRSVLWKLIAAVDIVVVCSEGQAWRNGVLISSGGVQTWLDFASSSRSEEG